ncbi:class I SAM-dependent methyltransferase [Hippea maritima]|uniref:Methyltransferase type 11 n=1 Tax=Hippea maritima (strain ATCC 700847 / DSM 10411 / MH2) TaxID=760142 RepID=F2LXI3_HIPMA|nr:methyltransferase domain-containing protein [Hippea maritima]AEA33169.1 Methyltransferase type 11 [Hippea maritima DSM 10411]
MQEFVKFLKQFLFHPIAVSSITPSSKFLSSAITKEINPKNSKIVFEFGCGSGAITKSIISNIKKDAMLVAFDINKNFTEIVKRKYPEVIVINDSVENVEKHMKQHSINKIDIIISSLPWAVFSLSTQSKLLNLIHRILRPNGIFITYSYLHTFIFPSQSRFRSILHKQFRVVRTSKPVWLNLPPAVIIKCIK